MKRLNLLEVTRKIVSIKKLEGSFPHKFLGMVYSVEIYIQHLFNK